MTRYPGYRRNMAAARLHADRKRRGTVVPHWLHERDDVSDAWARRNGWVRCPMHGVHPPHVQCPNCTVDRYRATLPSRRT